MNDYSYWQAATRGEKPKMYVDHPELGFYRKGVYERNDKGNNKRVGWSPVAVFMVDDVMTARVGSESDGRDVTGDALNELWSYISDNAITEDQYRAVARHGKPWHDAHDPAKNKNPAPLTQPKHPAPEGATAASPENVLAAKIADAKAGVSQYAAIDSDEMAGQALSLKNTITSLAGDLDKFRETLVRPHIDAQREVNDRLNPVIKDAKAQAQKLLGAIGAWEDTKRAAQRAAEEATRRQAEEDRRKQEWHDATPTGSIPEPVAPAPPVRSNAPPPATQVAAAVGRKASVRLAKFVTSIDLDKAFAQFRNEPAVNACLIGLAQRAVDAGLTVDGAVVEERSIVR